MGSKPVLQAQHNVGLLRPDLDAVIEAEIHVVEIVHQAVGARRLDPQIICFEFGTEVFRKAVLQPDQGVPGIPPGLLIGHAVARPEQVAVLVVPFNVGPVQLREQFQPLRGKDPTEVMGGPYSQEIVPVGLLETDPVSRQGFGGSRSSR